VDRCRMRCQKGSMPRAHRLFLALRPPDNVRARLSLVQAGVPGARWQSDAQLHITLRFIGEVDRHQAEDIVASLATVQAPALDVRVAGVGHFGKGPRLEAIWAGIDPKDAITALHAKLDRALISAGIAADSRAYLPHITLARFSASTRAAVAQAWLAEHAALSTAAFRLDSMALYESHLTAHGSHYEEIERWSLRPV